MSNSVERWSNTKKLTPFREFSQIEEYFDGFMNEMRNLKLGSLKTSFSPSCEISENKDHYIFRFDMPGVSKDQVQVEINGDQLLVHAERKDQKQSENTKKFLSEVFYGSYSRSFTLPSAMDERKVQAQFENGVLTIMVSKSEVIKPKQIPVS